MTTGSTIKVTAILALLACITAAAQVLRPQTPPTPGSAVVSGRVFDGDGETPARFAQVQLSSRTRTGGILYDTLTSEDGRFAFEAVQSGTYHLAAVKATYPPAFYSTDGKPVAEPGTAVQIAAGQELRDINIRVRKGGVIAGKVTDQRGDPVSISIGLRRLNPSVSGMDSPFYFNAPGNLRSDGRGEYRIYGLAPGDYYVMTDNTSSESADILPNGRRRTFAQTFFPDTSDPMAALPVTVAFGQEREGIDLVLRAVPLLKLAGTIAGPADLEDYVSVRLAPVSPLTLYLQTANGSASNRRFVIDEVRPGHYWLSATARQKPPADAPRGTVPLMWWTATPISMSDEDRADVILALQPAMSVTGQVVVNGQAADASVGMKRYFVSLTAIPGTMRITDMSAGIYRSTDDGRFTVFNLTPGRYKVTVSAASGPAPQLLSVAIGGQAVANDEIEIQPGTNIENVVVRIRIP